MAYNAYGQYDQAAAFNPAVPWQNNLRVPKANYMDTLDPATRYVDPRKTSRIAQFIPWASSPRSLRWTSICAIVLLIFLIIGGILGLVLGLIPFYTTRTLSLSFTTSTAPSTTTTTTTTAPAILPIDLNTTVVSVVVNGTNVRLNATQIAASPLSLTEKLKKPSKAAAGLSKQEQQTQTQPPAVNLEKSKSNDDTLDFEPVDLATPAPQSPFIGSSSAENLHIANKLTKDKVEQVRKELGIRDEEAW